MENNWKYSHTQQKGYLCEHYFWSRNWQKLESYFKRAFSWIVPHRQFLEFPPAVMFFECVIAFCMFCFVYFLWLYNLFPAIGLTIAYKPKCTLYRLTSTNSSVIISSVNPMVVISGTGRTNIFIFIVYLLSIFSSKYII